MSKPSHQLGVSDVRKVGTESVTGVRLACAAEGPGTAVRRRYGTEPESKKGHPSDLIYVLRKFKCEK